MTKCGVFGLLIGLRYLTTGCSDSEPKRPKELTTGQEDEFKAQDDAARQIDGKQTK
jgi:hypothetical protein